MKRLDWWEVLGGDLRGKGTCCETLRLDRGMIRTV